MNLITRSDFDGLTCAVLLREVEIIEEITFAHPKDVQDGSVKVTRSDILTNMPYHPDCGMWFDHHVSEGEREDIPDVYEGRFEIAPSAARVIFNHYKSHRFNKYAYLLAEVDKIDSASLSINDVVEPSGWVLLSYIMDPRTGLGRYHDYGISNKQLMYRMIDLIPEYTADEILSMHDVKDRARRYFEQEVAYRKMLESISKCDGNVIVTDTRGMTDVPTGNRFLVYTLFPDANVSMRIMAGKGGKNTVVALGHSIFNRSCRTNVGELCARYGGGGHRGAGTAQLNVKTATTAIEQILATLKNNG